MFNALTRQAETATTASVSTTPRAYATTTLRGCTENDNSMSDVADSAAAIADTIAYATASPSAAPTAAATTS